MQEEEAGPSPAASEPLLSADDKQTLLRLARQTLVEYLETGEITHATVDSRALLTPRATFVTLRQRDSGELRGCRGEFAPRHALHESVQRMVVASAVDDPRFPAVTAEEVPNLHIEISALTPLRPITPEEVVVGRHGLMIIRGNYSGLLLPQVPIEQGWNRTEFLDGLCWKAGLPRNAWMSHQAQLYGFEADVWGEE